MRIGKRNAFGGESVNMPGSQTRRVIESRYIPISKVIGQDEDNVWSALLRRDLKQQAKL
jgi:hypothetical protein